jgi:hypothetical protein
MIEQTKDYRATNDSIMVADIGFKKQLWALDSELDIVWDWAAKKWEIWRFPGQARSLRKHLDVKAHHVLTIQTQQRTFREIGADILLKLQQSDPTRYSLNELVAYFDKMDDNLKRSKERNLVNTIESIGNEVRWFFRGLRVQVPRRFEKAAIKIDVPKETKLVEVLGHGR